MRFKKGRPAVGREKYRRPLTLIGYQLPLLLKWNLKLSQNSGFGSRCGGLQIQTGGAREASAYRGKN